MDLTKEIWVTRVRHASSDLPRDAKGEGAPAVCSTPSGGAEDFEGLGGSRSNAWPYTAFAEAGVRQRRSHPSRLGCSSGCSLTAASTSSFKVTPSSTGYEADSAAQKVCTTLPADAENPDRFSLPGGEQ